MATLQIAEGLRDFYSYQLDRVSVYFVFRCCCCLLEQLFVKITNVFKSPDFQANFQSIIWRCFIRKMAFSSNRNRQTDGIVFEHMPFIFGDHLYSKALGCVYWFITERAQVIQTNESHQSEKLSLWDHFNEIGVTTHIQPMANTIRCCIGLMKPTHLKNGTSNCLEPNMCFFFFSKSYLTIIWNGRELFILTWIQYYQNGSVSNYWNVGTLYFTQFYHFIGSTFDRNSNIQMQMTLTFVSLFQAEAPFIQLKTFIPFDYLHLSSFQAVHSCFRHISAFFNNFQRFAKCSSISNILKYFRRESLHFFFQSQKISSFLNFLRTFLNTLMSFELFPNIFRHIWRFSSISKHFPRYFGRF